MDGEGDDRFSEHTPCYLRPGRQETRGHKYSLKLLRRLLRAFGQPFRNMIQQCWDMLRWNVAIVWPGLNLPNLILSNEH